MERVTGEHEGQRTSIKQVVSASVVGTALEWYDFSLYGTAAALVFGSQFFPGFSPLAGTLAAFATFGVGFFARPVGGIVFGHYGDKIGRKAVLIITLLLMGIATALIGLLPTYAQIGIWAPILLVFLRILQGLGAGAEFAGAVTLTAEYAPRDRRGFYASLPGTGVLMGILLAAGLFNLFALLPEEQFLAWGWRVPFLLSIVVVGVGLYIRFRILETPVFTEVKETHTEVRAPIVEVIRTHPKNLLLAIGACVGERGPSYIFQVFVLTYVAQQLGLAENVGLNGVLLAAAVGLLTLPAFGALSDRFGRRPVYMAGAAFLALYAFPYFWLLDTTVPVLIWLSIVLSYGVGIMSVFGPQSAYFVELFPTRVRYSGIALAREVSAAFTGGISPFVATALLSWAGSYWPVAIYIAAMALITLVCLYFLPETYRSEISEGRATVGLRPQAES